MGRKLVFMMVVLLLLAACTAGTLTGVALCSMNLMETNVPEQSIAPFVGTSDFTAQTLIHAAKERVAQDIGAIGSAHIGFAIVTYLCEGRDCHLHRVNVEIVSARTVACPALFTDSPGYNTLTGYVFDVAEDVVWARTHAVGELGLHSVEWEMLPVGLEEAKQIALETVGDEFAQQHDQFRLSFTRTFDHWIVRFYSDLTGQRMAEIELHIDYTTGAVVVASG